MIQDPRIPPCRARLRSTQLTLSTHFVAALAAMIASMTLGYFIYWIVPEAAPAVKAEAIELLLVDPIHIRPEPKERATYLALVIGLPAILCLLTALSRRFSRSESTSNIFIVVALAALLFVSARDPYWFLIGMGLAASWSVWGAAALVAGFVVMGPGAQRRMQSELIFRITAIIAVLVAGAWRWFGINTVSDAAEFTAHFDAVAYSVIKIATGGTCLVDVIPQYGCYGEILAPVIRAVGLSVMSLTLFLTATQVIGILCLIWLIDRLISNRLLAGCCLALTIISTNRIWNVSVQDPFFQYMPVRFIFPVISCVAAVKWIDRQTALRALSLGVVAGLAVVWNLDTGVAVVGALGAGVIMAGCTGSEWSLWPTKERRRMLAAYVGGVAAAIALFLLYLAVKAGAWPDLRGYFIFQQTFLGAGAYMLPASPLPSLWGCFVAVIIVCLVWLTDSAGVGRRNKAAEMAAYVSTIGAGLLIYYVGRSHFETLALVAWPFLLLTFILVDQRYGCLKHSLVGRVSSVVMLVFMLSFGYGALALGLPRVGSLMRTHWNESSIMAKPGVLTPRVEFVKSKMTTASRIEILAVGSAALYAEIGVRADAGQMSFAETLRREDADRQIGRLLSDPVDNLFLGAEQCCSEGSLFHSHAAKLEQVYDRMGSSPDGFLVHWRSKKSRAVSPVFLLTEPGQSARERCRQLERLDKLTYNASSSRP